MTFIYMMVVNIFRLWRYFDIKPEAYIQLKVFMAIMFIIIFILSLSNYGVKQIIKIDPNYLSYCSVNGFFAKYRQTYRILTGQDMFYEIQIKLSDIRYITLSYSDIVWGLEQKGHAIILDIALSDGTLIQINPDNLYFEKENYLKGIEYLEQLGVTVKDPYHLKDALKDKELRFAEYIDRMKRHEH